MPWGKIGRLTVPTVMPVIFTYNGNLIVRTGQSRVYVDVAATLVSVRASVATAPTGAAVIVDVLKNGTSVWNVTPANKPSIAAGTNTSGLVTVFDNAAAAVGDFYTVDINQIGSATPGAVLTVQLRFVNV